MAYEDKYVKDGYFDITAMINDDFIIAMKILWNARQYNSFLKLLLCFIDTMSFVSTGSSSPGSFKGWLKKYVDLSAVGITEDELWEHRNSLLHLSTHESIKVKQGKVVKIVPYSGQLEPVPESGLKYYSSYSLMMEVFQGIGRYLESMSENEKMKEIFCELYPNTISDTHYIHVNEKI